ncbi:FecR family protein [Synechococcus sp. EJ6-Ellesmere]|uniref:FecR family protein n=1 Tax=Synechococcus sp. EJ6-Ellesmere TaxID=2823734 RepID=UPI0020CE8036|nr:FecR family protein [Synechococcus sp. EJ6-Ellesmere]MCP9824083.1 FecR domain-containing protein [Synechococcus sp. EJ6-Ellesmere]
MTFTGLVVLAGILPAQARGSLSSLPKVVEVPSRPAYVIPPREKESDARPGQSLVPSTVLRTRKPGRLQVAFPDGRRFRLGGDSLALIGRSDVELSRGQIIGWLIPGRADGPPLRIRTRVGTASISGTTVFLEASPERLRIFSWEGSVQVEARDGQRFSLSSGEEVIHENGAWSPPRQLSRAEATQRRRVSTLLHGFSTPMETLPALERELDRLP